MAYVSYALLVMLVAIAVTYHVMSSRIEKLPDWDKEATEANIQALTRRVNALAEQLTNLALNMANDIDNIKTAHSSLKGRVTSAQRQITGLQATLTTMNENIEDFKTKNDKARGIIMRDSA